MWPRRRDRRSGPRRSQRRWLLRRRRLRRCKSRRCRSRPRWSWRLRELAMQAQCVAIEASGREQLWRLRVEREMLRAPVHRDKLQAALSQHLQQPVRIEIEAGVAEDSPAIRAGAERERRQREAEQIIHSDPLVQALMAQYKTARIVPGSVKPHAG